MQQNKQVSVNYIMQMCVAGYDVYDISRIGRQKMTNSVLGAAMFCNESPEEVSFYSSLSLRKSNEIHQR